MNSLVSQEHELEADLLVTTLHILIVEDEQKQVELLEDAIEDFNNSEKGKSVTIKYSIANKIEDAMFALLKDDFDAAIIDLKLGTDINEDQGLDLVTIIIDKLRFPVFIRSGYPEKAYDICSSHRFVKAYNKTDSLDSILDAVVEFNKNGITQTFGTKGKVEKYLNRIFWERLSMDLTLWDEFLRDGEKYEKAVVRYCFSLLHEFLEMDDTQEEYLDYHPFEVYIKPPVKTDHFNGDILFDQTNSEYYIILSPSCDMAQKKYERIIISKIIDYKDLSQFIECKEKYQEAIQNQNASKIEKIKKEILKYTSNNYNFKYHFLPSYHDFPGGFINFQIIQSKTKEELDAMIRIASVSGKFTKDIVARFSNYFARQGQPNLDLDTLLERVLI